MQALPDPLVRKLARYTALTETERAGLRSATAERARSLRPREDVVRQGSAVSDCCVVREGVLARYKLLPEGGRYITAFLLPGDWCDLAGFLEGRVEFGVMALTRASVACVSHRVLDELCAAHPNLTRTLWRESLREAAIGREWLVNLGQREAAQRLAHLLCELRLRFAAVGLTDRRDGGFHWPVTQADMADATGMSPVHVNRTLTSLRGADVLHYDTRRMVLRNEARLRHIAGFDPAYLGL